jgi:hypothetical protein
MNTDTFESDVRQALASRAAELPGEAVDRLRHRNYRPRTHGRAALAGAGLAAVTAVAAVAAVAAMQPATHPASAQLTAWTVTRQADGDFQVTINELRDPAGLQSELRADGIPASVTFGQPNPACTGYPEQEGSPLQGQVFGSPGPGEHPGSGYTADINPSALPSGAGVQFVVLSATAHQLRGMEDLVYTSQQCTGT